MGCLKLYNTAVEDKQPTLVGYLDVLTPRQETASGTFMCNMKVCGGQSGNENSNIIYSKHASRFSMVTIHLT